MGSRKRRLTLGITFLLVLLTGCSKEHPFEQGLKDLAARKYDAAIADFTRAIRGNPESASAYYNRGDAWLGKNDSEKAMADYTEAIRLNPQLPPAYYNRGNIYHARGDHDRAIADFSEALWLNGNFAAAYYNRGNAYKDTGQYDKAMADWSDAIRLDPKFTNAYNNRGNGYHARGDYEKAMADWSEAIGLNPKSWVPHASLARLLATCPKPEIRNGSKAVEHGRLACELSEWKAPLALNAFAAACAEAGDFEQAVRWEKRYLETSRLNEKEATAARQRLTLYELHKTRLD